MELKSFISEQTSEYILIPDLLRRLTPYFQHIIPICFRKTQEGNLTALKTMTNMHVQILTVFARRPKILLTQPNHITMKINRDLLEYAHASIIRKIPVIAGIPLASSLCELRADSPCSWYNLEPFTSSNNECFIEMNAEGHVIPETPEQIPPSTPLTDSEILALAKSSSVFSWNEAVSSLSDIRRVSRSPLSSRFFFFGGYRPFHFILRK